MERFVLEELYPIVPILFGCVFVHLILFYLTRISDILSKKISIRIVLLIWTCAFLFIIGRYFARSFSRKTRVVCLPILSKEPWLDITTADEINESLTKLNVDKYLFYRLEWIYDTIESDSLSDRDYLIDFGKRIDLDYLILQENISDSSDNRVFSYLIFNPNDDHPAEQFSDTLRFDQPVPFLQKSIEHISNFLHLNTIDFHFRWRLSPDLWKNYGRGRYYFLLGDPKKAELFFLRGIKQDSLNSLLSLNLISVYLDKGLSKTDMENADDEIYLQIQELFKRVAKNESTSRLYYLNLSRMYVQKTFWSKAEETLKRLYTLDKYDPETLFYLSRLHPSRYRFTGMKTKESLLKKCLVLCPTMKKVLISLADFYCYNNYPDKAEKLYHRLLQVQPSSIETLLALGKLYLVRNDVIKLISTYERVLEIDPANADAFYNLGIAYYNDKKFDTAIRFFRRAIEINNHVDSYLYLAVIYAQRENREIAIDLLRKRIRFKTNPDDPYAEQARKLLYDLLNDREIEF